MKHKRILLGAIAEMLLAVLYFSLMQITWFHGIWQDRLWMLLTFVTFLAAAAISFWEMQIFHRKTSLVRVFMSAYLPYLMQTAAIVLVTAALFWYVRKNAAEIYSAGIINPPMFQMTAIYWIVICIACAIVTFVTGAARTMLYHDDQKR